MRVCLLVMVLACAVSADDRPELKPIPIAEAVKVADRFGLLQRGMSAAEVSRTLGLGPLQDKLIRYEERREPRFVCVYIMRDGYAFVVIYELDSGTEGLALQEWLWRPELDWPSPPVKAVNSLASLGHPLRDTERVDLYGFRVGETDRGYWRVCASIHVPKSRLEQFRAKLPQVREVVERRLVGVPGREAIEQAQKRTVLQLDIRSALNDSFPGTPVRYIDVMIDEK